MTGEISGPGAMDGTKFLFKGLMPGEWEGGKLRSMGNLAPRRKRSGQCICQQVPSIRQRYSLPVHAGFCTVN